MYLHGKSLLQEEKLVQGTIVEAEGVDSRHILSEYVESDGVFSVDCT